MQFYLAGESPSASRDIDIDANGSLYDLQSLISAHFAIVEPEGEPTLGQIWLVGELQLT